MTESERGRQYETVAVTEVQPTQELYHAARGQRNPKERQNPFNSFPDTFATSGFKIIRLIHP